MAHQLEKAVRAFVSYAGAFHPNTPALVVLGRRPAFLHVSTMKQGIVHACCVVLSNKGVSIMNIAVIVRTLTPLADALDMSGLPYHLTGSLATSVYLKAQAVQGIEVVTDIKISQVPALVVQLEKMYDVKEVAMRAAIEHRGSFRLVHHDTLQKIDVALSAYRAYSQVRQERAQQHTLEQGSRAFYVTSPDDTILTLLERYNGGWQRFHRVWETILDLLAQQGSTLDLAYLRLWATPLDVALFLEQALASAGLSNA
jgi:acetolactate synthase regulatory subunit